MPVWILDYCLSVSHLPFSALWGWGFRLCQLGALEGDCKAGERRTWSFWFAGWYCQGLLSNGSFLWWQQLAPLSSFLFLPSPPFVSFFAQLSIVLSRPSEGPTPAKNISEVWVPALQAFSYELLQCQQQQAAPPPQRSVFQVPGDPLLHTCRFQQSQFCLFVPPTLEVGHAFCSYSPCTCFTFQPSITY